MVRPGAPGTGAAVRETHVGVVFLLGDRAYKIKKPVRTSFLDFSTPERRSAALRRELELNRRLAPDVYLGVSEVTAPADPDGARAGDGLDDVAFLAMDLERLGRPDLATRFLDAYVEFSGDPAPVYLRHHYIAYRAFVRAKVACLRHEQGDPDAAGTAAQHADLALAHLRNGAVRLALVGGLPGTGKMTVAGGLADRFGAVLLSSDRIRRAARETGDQLTEAGRLTADGSSIVTDTASRPKTVPTSAAVDTSAITPAFLARAGPRRPDTSRGEAARGSPNRGATRRTHRGRGTRRPRAERRPLARAGSGPGDRV